MSMQLYFIIDKKLTYDLLFNVNMIWEHLRHPKGYDPPLLLWTLIGRS